MLTPREQADQARLDELNEAYRQAAYATPRDEALCRRLAEQTLELCRGTHLEETWFVDCGGIARQ